MVNNAGIRINDTVLSLAAITSDIKCCDNIPYVIRMALILSELTGMDPEEALDVLYKNDVLRDVLFEELLLQLKEVEKDETVKRKIKEEAEKALKRILSTPRHLEDALSRTLYFMAKSEIEELEKKGLIFDVEKL